MLFEGLCLHILYFFGIGSNLCKTYLSPWKKKNQLLSNFYQLSQQTVKEIRHPACWLCCIPMAESWQGGHSLLGFHSTNMWICIFFSHFCQHTEPQNTGLSFLVRTHASAHRCLHSCGYVCLHLLHQGFLLKVFAYRNRNPWLFGKTEKFPSPAF